MKPGTPEVELGAQERGVEIQGEEGRYVETARWVIQSLFIAGRRSLHFISSHSCQNGCPKAGSQVVEFVC